MHYFLILKIKQDPKPCIFVCALGSNLLLSICVSLSNITAQILCCSHENCDATRSDICPQCQSLRCQKHLRRHICMSVPISPSGQATHAPTGPCNALYQTDTTYAYHFNHISKFKKILHI